MSSSKEEAGRILDELCTSIFVNDDYTEVMLECFFPLRPDERGAYTVIASIDNAKHDLERFKRIRATKLVTPNVLRDWFETSKFINVFMPEKRAGKAQSMFKKLGDRYNPSKGIAIIIEIVYTNERDAIWRPAYLTYCEATLEDFQKFQQNERQRMIDAGLSPRHLLELMNVDVGDFDPDSAESKSKAEEILAKRICHNCNADNASLKCSACIFTRYCNSTCQRADWSKHCKVCSQAKWFGEMIRRQAYGRPRAPGIVRNMDHDSI